MDPVVVMLILLIGCFCCCYCCSSMGAGGYYGYLWNVAACFGTPPDDEECPVIPWMGAGSMAGMMGLPGMIDAECIANSDDAEWGDGEVTIINEDGKEKKFTRNEICGEAKTLTEDDE